MAHHERGIQAVCGDLENPNQYGACADTWCSCLPLVVLYLRGTLDLFSRLELNSSRFQGEAAFEVPEAGTYFNCITDFVSQPYPVFVPENEVPFHASYGMFYDYSCC